MQVNIHKIERRIEELARRRYLARHPIGPLRLRPHPGAPHEAPVAISEAERQMIATALGTDAALSAITAPPLPADGVFLHTGDRWGQRDGRYLLEATVEIPPEWRSDLVVLHLDLSEPASQWDIATAEALLSIDGVPLHALDRYHREVILPPEMVARDRIALGMDVWSGITEEHHTLHVVELRRMHAGADRLHQTMKLLRDATAHLPEHATARAALLAALDAATLALDFRTDAAFYASCDAALGVIDDHLHALQTDPTDPWQPHVTLAGHAHIDVAWLWRLRHTRLKTANTFTTALYHMDRYPHFSFTASTPQLYQFVKEDHPDIYARIQQKVAAGQWEAEGVMWLEADTNITGGESLVRQCIFGKRFFQEEFGVDSKVLWLPDVFGYSAALPQLIKGADADYFITTKISWNDTNRFPNDTFWWEGLDGTRVLTHFITAQNADTESYYTYNGEAWPGVAVRSWRNYRQQALNHELLVAYGWGDGGGGPTREMVEAAGMQSVPLARDIPTASPGTVRAFMDRLATRVGDDPRLPTWVGELYFEYHRGTYTSQARTKRNNRVAERDLHNAELLATLANHLAEQPYPKAALDDAWRTVLTHQFHDILPGSSIGPVYADAEENYARVRATSEGIIGDALAALAGAVAAPAGALLVVNPLPWPRTDLIEIPAEQATALGLPMQPLSDGRAVAQVADIPALGFRVVAPPSGERAVTTTPGMRAIDERAMEIAPRGVPPQRPPAWTTIDRPVALLDGMGASLENSFYRIELNEQGQIVRLFAKALGREMLAEDERGNVFQLFEDKPNNFDAWDIDAFYAQKMWELDDLVECAVTETGPLRAGLRLVWRHLDRTTITQTIFVYADNPRIDFVTQVDWHERQTLLKVAFPVEIHNTFATAEIQFGNLRRPTHRNTSWERAQFETCAHKWVDLSEGDAGVAILNDCKYGYDVLENVMRLTLLRGAISPDPLADEGQHQFTYSLLPHAGDWFAGNVHRAAYELNYPLLHTSVPGGAGNGLAPDMLSVAQTSAANVIIETVKRAETSDDLVLRLYECANRRGAVTVTLPAPATQVLATNLLEANPEPIALAEDGRSFTFTILPYQIRTFSIRR
jgi:alpha-mannosidase